MADTYYDDMDVRMDAVEFGFLLRARKFQKELQQMAERLITLAEYRELTPYQQGFVVYMQAAWPNSELVNEVNPYEVSDSKHQQWKSGEAAAVAAVQDMEA